MADQLLSKKLYSIMERFLGLKDAFKAFYTNCEKAVNTMNENEDFPTVTKIKRINDSRFKLTLFNSEKIVVRFSLVLNSEDDTFGVINFDRFVENKQKPKEKIHSIYFEKKGNVFIDESYLNGQFTESPYRPDFYLHDKRSAQVIIFETIDKFFELPAFKIT